jgi:Transposase
VSGLLGLEHWRRIGRKEGAELIFVGDDWSEDHHDIELLDEEGSTLVRRRLPEGLVGVGQLHELLAGYASEPSEIVVGIETDRGLWVQSLVAAGYQVYAPNPRMVARYREPSPIPETPRCWLIWCEPIVTFTGR